MKFKMATIETDYLIVGAGLAGLSFADTLLDQTDSHITIVDRHGKPGGHWNDAYTFVALHQPSALYGVNSLTLGSDRKEETGVNRGLYEQATGHEVCAYFDRVMRQRFLPSGRVAYYPMTDYVGSDRFVSLLSGRETDVVIRRKLVDATFYRTSVPSTHTPKYHVAEGVRAVPPNALPQLWRDSGTRRRRFVIIGAGKTAMDVGVWLLNSGADPEAASWVIPRDSWVLNRLHVQPGLEFFNETFGGQVAQMRALAEARTTDEMFIRLENDGVMLRLDQSVKPSMFHYATISTGELATLRLIKHTIRFGRVRAIEPRGLVLENGRMPMDVDTLYIDCTAVGIEKRPVVTVFEPRQITLQMVRLPRPAFSAALIAYVEANYADDAQKNQFCKPIEMPDSVDDFPLTILANIRNLMQWESDKTLSDWIRNCRLDVFGKIASVAAGAGEKRAVLESLKTYSAAAGINIPKLVGFGLADH